MAAYYNEHDPYAAQWLRNLIVAEHIAPGDVDDRSMALVQPDDLKGYTQCHFFAGIGVWSYALRRAGWSDDTLVWTGSCPCQPFSAAGKHEGTADARHLWPHWFRLIHESHPDTIFGEQVATAIRYGWLDAVCSDLEGLDYAVGAAVVGAHSVGAPHIRQRLYFVADSKHAEWRPEHQAHGETYGRDGPGRGGNAGELVNPKSEQVGFPGRTRQSGSTTVSLGDTKQSGLEGFSGYGDDRDEPGRQRADKTRSVTKAGTTSGRSSEDCAESGRFDEFAGDCRRNGSFWSSCDWIPCIDGKARPIEPGTFPLAYGAPARVGRLRAYGNAICAETAVEFINAYTENKK